MSKDLQIETFDFDGTIEVLRRDFDLIEGCDALDQVKEIYRGVLFFSIQNLYQLQKLVSGSENKVLETWLEEGKGRYKKASIDTLNLFRTNLLPDTDFTRIVEKLKDCYLDLGSPEEDREAEMKKKLVLTLFSLNFTLFFEGGEGDYMEAQEWLMDREFGDL